MLRRHIKCGCNLAGNFSDRMAFLQAIPNHHRCFIELVVTLGVEVHQNAVSVVKKSRYDLFVWHQCLLVNPNAETIDELSLESCVIQLNAHFNVSESAIILTCVGERFQAGKAL